MKKLTKAQNTMLAFLIDHPRFEYIGIHQSTRQAGQYGRGFEKTFKWLLDNGFIELKENNCVEIVK